MTSTSEDPSVAHRRGGQLIARLASRFDEALAAEGLEVAGALLEHVRGSVPDFSDFERRVQRSEEFALHESAQVARSERTLRVYYQRARDLEATVEEAVLRDRSRAPSSKRPGSSA